MKYENTGYNAATVALATLIGGSAGALLGANATAAALAAQNEALNNSTSDKVVKWVKETYKNPLGDLARWGKDFLGMLPGQTPPTEANPLVDATNSGNPPAMGGAVITPPVAACTPGGPCVMTPPIAAPGAPGNAMLSNENGGENAENKATNSGDSSLLDPKAEKHVLYGDGPNSGGHLAGVGKPGKSEFLTSWGPQEVTNAILDIATNPQTRWSASDPRNGYVTGSGTVNGVEIKVVIDPNKGRIVTGYPTNLPRNPK
ncbi:EndoU domain-containing protein [Cupriavidus pauculus]|uniref:Bacterial EndoU nuclease domain-containing protein n=1 Tax=Cupriavidus pauculus TaxID=82633 RepID=A0A3G8H3Q4_9BURK|nr:EndoU domain-containing protein [Cupriavidus pauculus]AZG14885.1 hypothetical protein EHF44_16465 [Cupriavidus pauculus]